MKIAFDFHGVLEKHPNVFRPLMEALTNMGATIHVISGPSINKIEHELLTHGYECHRDYKVMTSVIDFLEYNDMTIWRDDNGDWWASDEDWWSSKAKICERDGIDILIDDSERYAPYFKDIKTEFILFKDCNFDNILQGIVNTIRKEGTDIK